MYRILGFAALAIATFAIGVVALNAGNDPAPSTEKKPVASEKKGQDPSVGKLGSDKKPCIGCEIPAP